MATIDSVSDSPPLLIVTYPEMIAELRATETRLLAEIRELKDEIRESKRDTAQAVKEKTRTRWALGMAAISLIGSAMQAWGPVLFHLN